ncbi:putative endonuclease [Ruminiclostridium sufflavum DSM 19573]|uniref:UPF0102 protein LY28_02473 n=1 Tax=Ruminiclostridium sufflavum DSM 19573 TaxID=1121337 RepID=A0A318XIN5_9FIRM|nr:YraN family protein [Ruminiclostridium sufflavum]PYG87090.1 putative endonuclease [Ruminiclostridium sufflavum DSM 19573]
MTDNNTRKVGHEGEKKAVEYLKENNYEILKTNFRAGRIGEIDIIAKEAQCICFIEVKTRKSLRFGMPREAVTVRKQEKIKLIASVYLSNTGNMNQSVRFDVIEINMKNNNSVNEIENISIIKNAF